MKLATRISLFFLSALALVLVGMSVCIYVLVRSHLLRQDEERSIAALETLTASLEFEPSGLEWEMNVRRLEFGQSPDGPFAWGVFEPDGHRLDGSKSPGPALVDSSSLGKLQDEQSEDVTWNGQPWRVDRRMVRSQANHDSSKAGDSTPVEEPNHEALAGESATVKRYPALVMAFGRPLTPALRPLSGLAIALAGMSIVIWTLAAVGGQWLAARALAPITRMSQTAANISGADLAVRLPSPGTGDELEDLGAAFNKMLDRLQVSFERQRRFAAEASHQLRTPLAGILGQIEVALRRDRSAEEYRQSLESAHRQAELLRQIVETLLFITRENIEGTQLQLEPLDLRQWLTTHLLSWQEHPRHDDLQLELNSSGPLCVSAHAVLLGQAIDNLIDNACKYSEPGTAIMIRVSVQDNEVRLAVEDQGCGISELELAHVFDPFFRCTHARNQGLAGLGLGLSVVRRIVIYFNGRAEVDSVVGRGSRFTIVLPTAVPAPAPLVESRL